MQPTNSVKNHPQLTVGPMPQDLSLFQDSAFTFRWHQTLQVSKSIDVHGEPLPLLRASYHDPRTWRNVIAHSFSILNEFLNSLWQQWQESQALWSRHRMQRLTAINNSPTYFHTEKTEQYLVSHIQGSKLLVEILVVAVGYGHY
jgi:hypothetical protein